MAKYHIQLRELVTNIPYVLRFWRDMENRLWLQFVRKDNDNRWAPVVIETINNQPIPARWLRTNVVIRASDHDGTAIDCSPTVQIRSDISEGDFDIEVIS